MKIPEFIKIRVCFTETDKGKIQFDIEGMEEELNEKMEDLIKKYE